MLNTNKILADVLSRVWPERVPIFLFGSLIKGFIWKLEKNCVYLCSFVLLYNIWNFKKTTTKLHFFKYFVGVFLFVCLLGFFCNTWRLKWSSKEMKVLAVVHSCPKHNLCNGNTSAGCAHLYWWLSFCRIGHRCIDSADDAAWKWARGTPPFASPRAAQFQLEHRTRFRMVSFDTRSMTSQGLPA